jgi:hypothetical protein
MRAKTGWVTAGRGGRGTDSIRSAEAERDLCGGQTLHTSSLSEKSCNMMRMYFISTEQNYIEGWSCTDFLPKVVNNGKGGAPGSWGNVS